MPHAESLFLFLTMSPGSRSNIITAQLPVESTPATHGSQHDAFWGFLPDFSVFLARVQVPWVRGPLCVEASRLIVVPSLVGSAVDSESLTAKGPLLIRRFAKCECESS